MAHRAPDTALEYLQNLRQNPTFSRPRVGQARAQVCCYELKDNLQQVCLDDSLASEMDGDSSDSEAEDWRVPQKLQPLQLHNRRKSRPSRCSTGARRSRMERALIPEKAVLENKSSSVICAPPLSNFTPRSSPVAAPMRLGASQTPHANMVGTFKPLLRTCPASLLAAPLSARQATVVQPARAAGSLFKSSSAQNLSATVAGSMKRSDSFASSSTRSCASPASLSASFQPPVQLLSLSSATATPVPTPQQSARPLVAASPTSAAVSTPLSTARTDSYLPAVPTSSTAAAGAAASPQPARANSWVPPPFKAVVSSATASAVARTDSYTPSQPTTFLQVTPQKMTRSQSWGSIVATAASGAVSPPVAVAVSGVTSPTLAAAASGAVSPPVAVAVSGVTSPAVAPLATVATGVTRMTSDGALSARQPLAPRQVFSPTAQADAKMLPVAQVASPSFLGKENQLQNWRATVY
eukprot:TRINITY_DN113366_c0_g1_i1.p1 TRINITY_DN113366_c0_g1~~TRINITY_DN113366_c0_g1_i1.p1  ORF type:complete len:467 (+),score=75.01 TRINITY_DN113366_c0_g1_i1:57-1457(+)